MQKKVAFFYGLINHRYILRMRNLKNKMLNLASNILRGSKEFLESHELIFGALYLIWYILCILGEAPLRIWNKILARQ